MAQSRNDAPGLDTIDLAILDHLRANARITNRALAQAVGLSPTPCLRRVQRMERQGVIAGYTIVPGRAAGMVAFVGVRLGRHERALTRNFEEQVIELPTVDSAWHITGGFDYLLRVSVHDLAEYRRFHAEQLAAIPGVAQVTTFVVMKELTAEPGYERT